MQPAFDFDRLPLRFRDPLQRRYEIMRPVILLQDRTATQRAEATGSPPATIGPLTRRFEPHGRLGLLPGHLHVGPSGRRGRVPEAVGQELERLKGLDDGLQCRERARMIFYRLNHRMSHSTVQRLWSQLPPASPQPLPRLDYHRYPERSQARQQVIALYVQG